MQTRFLRVTKDNPQRDRGLIAIDAICSIVENRGSKNVSIMTMDGFWYDVVDDLDSICKKIFGDGNTKEMPKEGFKKEQFRKRKMMTPSVAEEKVPQNHEEFVKTITPRQEDEQPNDIFIAALKKHGRAKKGSLSSHISSYLPSGEGKGHYDLNPPPPSGDALRALEGL